MMHRVPEFVPHRSGVFALKNDRRKIVYVSWTQNLQKRSHAMSHMLLRHDRWLQHPKKIQPYWPIRDLPKHKSSEFIFVVERIVSPMPTLALQEVNKVQRRYQRQGYKIVSGNRATTGMVRVEGRKMRLAEAVREYSDDDYLTVYRRLERGWTTEQALGLEKPDPRWHTPKQKLRKQREKERYEMRVA